MEDEVTMNFFRGKTLEQAIKESEQALKEEIKECLHTNTITVSRNGENVKLCFVCWEEGDGTN